MLRPCPRCNEKIDYLVSTVSGVMMQYLSINKQGDVQYEVGEFEPNEDTIYYCPACGNEIPFIEKEAIAFLKGE